MNVGFPDIPLDRSIYVVHKFPAVDSVSFGLSRTFVDLFETPGYAYNVISWSTLRLTLAVKGG